MRRTICATLLAGAIADASGQAWVPDERTGPPALAGHGMAYDTRRGELVVFGGLDASWMIGNRTWVVRGNVVTEGPPAPAALAPRWHVSMVYDSLRDRIVVAGGNTFNAGGFPDVTEEVWELANGAWTQGVSMPRVTRFTVNDRGMVFDGSRAVLVHSDGTLAYDGIRWTLIGPHPGSDRIAYAMAFDPNRQRTVLFGGHGYAGKYIDETWQFDGSTWIRSNSGAVPGRRRARMAFIGNGRVAMFGGAAAHGALDDTWIFDGTTWTAGPPAPPALGPRYHHELLATSPGRVVLFGGESSRRVYDDRWEFDGTSWTRPNGEIDGRVGAAIAPDPTRGRMVLFGGSLSIPFSPPRDGTPTADTWEHDGTGWTPGPPAPAGLVARSDHAMTWDAGRGRVVLFGGYAGGGNYLDDTWEYDGSGWIAGPASPTGLAARAAPGMTYDARLARTVVVGGRDASVRHADCWSYDGTAWSAGPALPPAMFARSDTRMAHDTRRGITVLYGGDVGALLADDTWELGPAGWAPGAAAPGDMAGRRSHGMVYDQGAERVVVFGGSAWVQGDVEEQNDTWLYDGTAWREGAPAPGAFLPRTLAAMGYDPVRRNAIVFGGTDLVSDLADTWTFRPAERATILAGEGHGHPNANRIRAHDATGAVALDITAYAAGHWGTTAAGAALLPGSTETILTGPGPGPVFGPHVRAFDAGGAPQSAISFYAYGTLKYGVNVAAGDLDGDARDEMLTAPGPGEVFGAHVRAWSFDGAVRPVGDVNFFAFPSPRYGARAVAGDVDPDGRAEILASPGPGPWHGAQVRGFRYDGTAVAPMGKLNFFAFGGPTFGAVLATGDVDGDAAAEVVVAPGPGPTLPARYVGFDLGPAGATPLAGFDVLEPGTTYGGRVAALDVRPDGLAELVGAPGPDPAAPSTVRVWQYEPGYLIPTSIHFDAFPGDTFGTDVSGGQLGL